MKSNSSGKCIQLGYRLYAQNFSKIFRGTWLQALVYAVICGTLGTLVTRNILRMSLMIQDSPEQATHILKQFGYVIVCTAALVVIGGLVELAFYSTGIAMLQEHRLSGKISRPAKWFHFDKFFFWRTFKAALPNLVVGIVMGFICILYFLLMSPIALQHPLLFMSIGFLIVILFLVAWLPMVYPLVKYIFHTESKLIPTLKADYKKAWRYWGFIFSVALSSFFVLFVVQLILTLPNELLALINYQSLVGNMDGDDSGLPSFIVLLTVFIGFIAGFVQIYVRQAVFFPFYYMTGSISSQEQEQLRYQEETADKDIPTTQA